MISVNNYQDDKKQIPPTDRRLHQSAVNNNLSASKTRQLFLEDNDNIDIKNTYKITNVHPPLDEKDVVNKEYCDNNLLSSDNKIIISSKKITELSKSEFDEITTKKLQLNKTFVNDELINEFTKSKNEVTRTIKLCKKVAFDAISRYNQLKLEIDNIKLNQKIANIQLDDMFTTGLREFKEVNEETTSAADEAIMRIRKTIVQYIIAKLLESKLVGSKEQARIGLRHDFNHEDRMKEINSYFTRFF